MNKPTQPLRLVHPRPIAGMLPPHDLEAEHAVLSAVLLKADALPLVQRILKPEHFYSPANQVLFEACLAMSAAGSPIDVVTVHRELADRERLAKVGGAAYLARILDSTPAVSHVEGHARIVLRKARVRALIAAMQEAAAEGYVDHGDDDEWVRDVSARIDDAARSGVVATDEDVTIGEAVEAMRRDLERERELSAIGVRTGMPIGIDSLERLTGGLHPTDVVMLSAPTKGYKTTVALSVAMAVAGSTERYVLDGREHERGRGVAIFELEMPAKELAKVAACAIGNVARDKFRTGEATDDDRDRAIWGSRAFNKLPIRIDSRVDLTVELLRAAVREKRIRLMAEFRAPLRLVVIDTIQILALAGNTDAERAQGLIDHASRSIRSLSLDPEFAGISWLVLSQLNEAGKMRGSRAIEQHCTAWWDLRVRDDRSPMGRDYRKIATFTIRLQRAGKQGSDVCASTWINSSTGAVGGDAA
jgi:replicative DNA helicase